MRIIASTLVLLGLCSTLNAQVLKDSLYNQVSDCYEKWKQEQAQDAAETGRRFTRNNITYDIPNGYVETSGVWETCDCGCKAKALAFKDSKKRYTYIRYKEFDCKDYGKSTASRDLKDILPEGFGLETFVGHQVDTPDDYSFQAIFVVPRLGIEMNVHLRVLPLGSVPNKLNGLTFESTEELNIKPSLGCVKILAQELSNNTLLQLAAEDYENVPTEEKESIEKTCNDANIEVKELCACLKDLKNMHDVYNSLECTDVKLKWNPKTAKFEIDSKSGKVRKSQFFEFLVALADYASVKC